KLWEGSFVEVNRARTDREMAATLVRDRTTNALSIINRHAGGSGASTPDRVDPIGGRDIVGTFHTHPYLSGETASIDDADLAEFINSSDLVKIVQSGLRQFMHMRTLQTPKHVDAGEMRSKYNTARKKLLSRANASKLPRINQVEGSYQGSRCRGRRRSVSWPCSWGLTPVESGSGRGGAPAPGSGRLSA